MEVRYIEFTPSDDSRGTVFAIESLSDIPFAIECVYHVIPSKPGISAKFIHRSAWQLAICISGSCNLQLAVDGISRIAKLVRPTQGVIITPGISYEFAEISDDCVLLILSSAKNDSKHISTNSADDVG